MLQISKAQKSQVPLKLALTGTSGSGKTYSGLVIAFSIGEKVLVVDTENKSASLYADKFLFDTIQVEPPFTPQTVTDAIELAVKHGYDTVVFDSLSHYWAGTGGLLQQKEALDATGKGNGYTNWAKMTPMQEKMVDAILQSKLNIIATMRSKQDYVIENVNGKNVPKKVGLAPVQRDGLEYEFTTVFDMSNKGMAVASKDRTGLWSDTIPFMVTSEVGKKIKEWCNSGIPAPEPQKQVQNPDKADSSKQEKSLQDEADLTLKQAIVKDIATLFKENNAKLGITDSKVDEMWDKVLRTAEIKHAVERKPSALTALTIDQLRAIKNAIVI